MARDWEAWLETASGPASPTEEQERERTQSRIEEAIREADDLPSSVQVYAKGSYANGTNVRRGADVDIAVEWTETAKVHRWGKTADLTAAELGFTPVVEPITPAEFRRRVEHALTDALGDLVDTSPDKHIGVDAGSSTLDADVVPCFSLHRYDDVGIFVEGHRIYPKSSGPSVDNYPAQNLRNGNTKNSATSGRYKEIVRCCKRLFQELYDDRKIGQEYPGYLTECLIFNVPNDSFGHVRRLDDMRAVFHFLWNGLKVQGAYEAWDEPSQLLKLYRGRPDRKPGNAHRIVDRAWDEIGVA